MSLALLCDGFFALRIGKGKGAQHVSGLWRLERNGVDLSLINLAYEPIRMSAGREAIHGTLPHAGHVALKPVSDHGEGFQITGMLRLDRPGGSLTDVGSGLVFPLPHGLVTPQMSDKFAVAEVAVTGDQACVTRLVSHSGPVPRFYAPARYEKSKESFAKGVVEKFWILPSTAGVDKAALHFSRPDNEIDGKIFGRFDISGPGLRLEGQYEASGEKLTMKAGRDSVRNLQLIGAAAIGSFFLGDLNWNLSPRGLELSREGRKFLLLPGTW